MSLSARRAWIEIETRPSVSQTVESLSARRAWIEIDFSGTAWVQEFVALRKESVDRNLNRRFRTVQHSVALRKESVDRNRACTMTTTICIASLSARRAWIEILVSARHVC